MSDLRAIVVRCGPDEEKRRAEIDQLHAKRLLVHYFRTVMQAQGLQFDQDCVIEIEGIVDDLIGAAVHTMLGRDVEVHI